MEIPRSINPPFFPSDSHTSTGTIVARVNSIQTLPVAFFLLYRVIVSILIHTLSLSIEILLQLTCKHHHHRQHHHYRQQQHKCQLHQHYPKLVLTGIFLQKSFWQHHRFALVCRPMKNYLCDSKQPSLSTNWARNYECRKKANKFSKFFDSFVLFLDHIIVSIQLLFTCIVFT